MEKITHNQGPERIKTTVIRINGVEHNIKNLLDLLHAHGITVERLAASNTREDALERVSNDFIPSMNTRIVVTAPYSEIKKVLEQSDEFRPFINNILGEV